MASSCKLSLAQSLAEALPEACRFNVHHLSTPPTSCPAIFAAPPGEQAEETYCESHFLSVSIDHPGCQLQVFAIEILIYTTEYLTTLFVSKADSTGYLYLLKLPQATPSPLRIISTTFLQYLIERRKRSDRSLVLSLFARAQNQYLFPGSVENSHKHVLDDRGLIKWWCKVVDPLLGPYRNRSDAIVHERRDNLTDDHETIAAGFLRVPGCDTYETRSLLPKPELRGTPMYLWTTGDPLKQIGKSATLPERCLIPRFPDDPKARFVDTLDDEVPDEDLIPELSYMLDYPSKTKNAGRWRSVRSLEQFWEMMQFRQECSSGRLVGFLWATFQSASNKRENHQDAVAERLPVTLTETLPNPAVSQRQEIVSFPPQSPLRSESSPRVPMKTPPASPSKPSPAPTPVKAKEASIKAQLEKTKHYYWPISSRGEVVLRQKDYKRVGDLMLRLDYANEETATDSTRKWTDDVAQKAGVASWGCRVIGTRAVEAEASFDGNAAPMVLNAGLMRKKKRSAEGPDGPAAEAEEEKKESEVKMLSAGLVRKKVKVPTHLGSVSNGDVPSNSKTELG